MRDKKSKMKKAEDGTVYPACESLPFTPGFKNLAPGTKCFVICPKRVHLGMLHSSVRCTVKECYKRVILIGVGRGHNSKYLISPDYLVRPKRDGALPVGWLHKLLTRSTNCLIGFPKNLLTYIRKDSTMGRGDKRVASKKRVKKKLKKKRSTPAERKTKAMAVSSKRQKKPKKKRVTITGAMFAYFDKVGLEKVTYERSLKVAQMVKPDTAFNHGHFSWYRNRYRLEHDID